MVVAAMDVGLKRIGLALSPDGKVALPQPAVLRKNRNQAAREVSDFLRRWQVGVLVAGIPQEGASREEMARRVRHFVGLLDFSGEVVYMDESFSSKEAVDRMKGAVKIRRDGRLDSTAAQVILERYLFARSLDSSSSDRK